MKVIFVDLHGTNIVPNQYYYDVLELLLLNYTNGNRKEANKLVNHHTDLIKEKYFNEVSAEECARIIFNR